MHPLIIVENGLPIDHIGLGVPDFDAAVAMIEAATGVRPLELDRIGAQRRAVGRVGTKAFLEIIGPAADASEPLDPVTEAAARLDAPRVLSWYVGVSDFDGYAAHAEKAGHALIMTQHVARNGYEYKIGGPDGIVNAPVIPWAIEWVVRAPAIADWPLLGHISAFGLEHPEPEKTQAVMDALNVAMTVAKTETGDARALVTIDGPKGVLSFR